MKSEEDVPVKGIVIGILVIVGIFLGSCALYPQYKVYKKTQDGKAALEEAKQDRQITIEEAQANLESERLNAQAEVERAKGAAEAIDIENGKLTDRYIQYLWVRSNNFDAATTIYVPTETGLPILEAGKRP